MEAVMFHGSTEQSLYPYKSHIGNQKRINNPFISLPSHNFLPSNYFNTTMGILQAPPHFLSHSYPSPYSLQQPPLLPLPVANPHRGAVGRGLSCPSFNKRTKNGNNTPKKSKSPTKYPKNEKRSLPNCDIVAPATSPLGPPDPKKLPKNVTKVLPITSSPAVSISSIKAMGDNNHEVEVYSNSMVFTISPPPPSSLPLPTFSLRPKLSCKAEAAGIDTGATDNLRRLLRLR